MMKKIVYLLIVVILLSFSLLAPQEAKGACSQGLLLWANSLVPTLLPFMILSNLFIALDGAKLLSTFLYPLFHALFGCSRSGCYAVAVGFLCGYPMGARTAADLVREKQISVEEGNYLLCFCNNASPAFFCGYCLNETLKQPRLVLPGILLLYGTPIFWALCHRQKRSFLEVPSKKRTSGFQISFKIVDVCMMNGLESILKLGCYLILFSMLARLIIKIPCPFSYISYAGAGMLEFTNGIWLVSRDTAIPLQHKYLFFLGFLSFGGICTAVQTESMLQDSELSIRSYLKAKLNTTVLTLCLGFLFILLNS